MKRSKHLIPAQTGVAALTTLHKEMAPDKLTEGKEPESRLAYKAVPGNESADALLHKDGLPVTDDPEVGIDPVAVEYKDKKTCYLILAVLLVIVTGLGVTGFFLRPQKPEVTLLNFKYDQGSPATPDEDGELYTNWIGTVLVKSDNLLSFHLREIDVKAYLPSNHQIPVGTGKAKDILIKSRDTTIFEIPFRVPVFKPSSGRPSLLEACMEAPRVTLLVDVSIDLNVLHWTGKRLNSSLKKEIDCQLPQLYNLVKDIIPRR